MAYELLIAIIEEKFHQFIARNRYYFDVHTFIGQQINEVSFEDGKLCRLNHGFHGEEDTSISDIVEIKEMDNIAVQGHIKTRWIGHNVTLRMTQIINLYVCMIN